MADDTNKLSEEIAACPFCGYVGLGFADGSTHRWGIASCNGCGATAGETRREYPDTGAWHAAAIKEWNTRATPPALPASGEAGEPLTNDEIQFLREKAMQSVWGDKEQAIYLARAIEAAHGIGGNAEGEAHGN